MPFTETQLRMCDKMGSTYYCQIAYVSLCLRMQNGVSRLISALCVNCLISILEYSRLNHLDVYLV